MLKLTDLITVVDPEFKLHEFIARLRIFQAEYEQAHKTLSDELIEARESKSIPELMHTRKALNKLTYYHFEPYIWLSPLFRSENHSKLFKGQVEKLRDEDKYLWLACLKNLITEDIDLLDVIASMILETKIDRNLRMNAFVIGNSGMGKTNALRFIAFKRNIPFVPTGTTDAPDLTSRVYKAMRKSLNIMGLHPWPTTQLLHYTKCVIIDEIPFQEPEANRIGSMLRDNHISAIFSSRSSLDEIPETFLDRNKIEHPILPYLEEKLQELMFQLDFLLPLPQVSGLSNPQIVEFIERETKGNMYRIMTIITIATERAIKEKQTALSLDLLRDAAISA